MLCNTFLYFARIEILLAEFYNISNWILREWETTLKGTRPQKIFEEPESRKTYYFKQSKLEYPSEIWSEIIASKLGQQIGIETLDYNVALYENKLGCLSESMIVNNLSMLYHGVDVLNDFLPEFLIVEKPAVNFQQIEKICSLDLFDSFLPKFIEMIVFDTIIGNMDRHTENWAFIINVTLKLKKHKAKPKLDLWGTVIDAFKNPYNPSKKSKITTNLGFDTEAKYSFSPIYDNGSCLAREKTEEEIRHLLKDTVRLNAYLNRGKHEIRWENDKLNFFDFCKKIQKKHNTVVREILNKISQNLTKDNVSTLVHGIDNNVLGKIENTYLTMERKELIIMLVLVRLQRLKEKLEID